MKIKKMIKVILLLVLLCNCTNKKTQNIEINNAIETTPIKTDLAKGQSDKVFDGDVYLLTQEDVDQFGKNNYTYINGDLIIGDTNTSDFSEESISLKSLKSIKKINGKFLLTKFKNLISTEGLENIEKVNGDFTISECGIEAIDNLDKVTEINGDLLVGNNDFGSKELQAISTFNELTKVENIYITGNNSLKILDAFNKIKETRTVYISSTSLKKIDCFKLLKKVDKNFSVEYSEPFEYLSLANLEEVNGFFAFHENDHYNGKINLPNAKKINHLYFMSNRNLDDYCGFYDLVKQNKIDTLSSSGNKKDLSKNQILQNCKK